MSNKRSILLRGAIFIAVGLVTAATVHLAMFLLSPPSPVKEFKEVLIAPGSSYRAVAAELKKQGIIRNVDEFIIVGRLMGVTKSVRAGFYSLNTAMRPLDVIRVLETGRIIEYQVVLPEGHTIMNTADVLQDAGLVSREEFLALATDPDFVHSLGLEADTLEGYLFPATYYFPKGATVEGIIRRLVSKYKDVFNDDLKSRAANLGMTEHQVVTLASLIEREAMLDPERMLISAVFHNRLRKGMLLQCDPTVIYALQKKGLWDGNITREDLRMKNPYNTYVNPGLPPGPIANPGKPSIIAALYPADVDYIFFVSRGDGSHFFSSNIAEHNRAVAEYRVIAAAQAAAQAAEKEAENAAREAAEADDRAGLPVAPDGLTAPAHP